MDLKQKQSLLDEYWKAETSIEEESVLKQEAKGNDSPEAQYFDILSRFDDIKLDDSFDDNFMKKTIPTDKTSTWDVYRNSYKLIAASIVIVLASMLLIFSIQQEKAKPLAMEDDPKKAFEMTKQALMMISSRLNKGTEYTKELGLFDHTKSKIKKLEN